MEDEAKWGSGGDELSTPTGFLAVHIHSARWIPDSIISLNNSRDPNWHCKKDN